MAAEAVVEDPRAAAAVAEIPVKIPLLMASVAAIATAWTAPLRALVAVAALVATPPLMEHAFCRLCLREP
jgi:hypothetical protein